LECNASGIFNLVGDHRISKHEFGVRLAHAFGLDTGLIRPARLADARGLVPRPLDMSLDNRKASRMLARPLGGVDAHLAQLRAQEEQGLPAELATLARLQEPVRT
jgi:dTDP-4-dehydrorhamnose reductase